MTDWDIPSLSIDNKHRSKEKVRHLTAEQLDLPENTKQAESGEDHWEELEELASSIESNQEYAVAVGTNSHELASGQFLQKGQSHDVHALELAVWKAYAESRSPITNILLVESEGGVEICGRCMQVVQDYASGTTLRILHEDGEYDEYSSIREYIAPQPELEASSAESDKQQITTKQQGNSSDKIKSASEASVPEPDSEDIPKASSDLGIEYIRFENNIYHRKYQKLDRTFCGQDLSNQKYSSSEEKPILLEPCKPCHGETGVITVKEKKQNLREQISEQAADITHSENSPGQFSLEEMRILCDLIPTDLSEEIDSKQEIRAQLDRAIEGVKTTESDHGSFSKDGLEALVGALSGHGIISSEPHFYIQTDAGTIKRTPVTEFDLQNRGGKGLRAHDEEENADIDTLFVANPRDLLLLFTSAGKVYEIGAHEMPKQDRIETGQQFSDLVSLDEDEQVQSVLSMTSLTDHDYLTMVTKHGFVKRVRTSEFENILSTGIVAAKLEDSDEVRDVAWTEGDADLIVATENGQAIRFDEEEVRDMGRSARGIKSIELDDDDSVIGMVVVSDPSNAQLLSVTRNGYGKRTPIREYRKQTRYGRGLIDIDTGDRNGPLMAIERVEDSDSVGIITQNGQLIHTPVDDISSVGRNTKGVILIDVDQGDRVIEASTVQALQKS
jgi:DNA gyrase subunit A